MKQPERVRKNVKVHLIWDEYGEITPLRVYHGDSYYDVRVLEDGKAAAARVGGFGICFKVRATAADSDVSGTTRVFFEKMPGQQCGVLLDPDNCDVPEQLWHYYDEHGERQNVSAEVEWLPNGNVKPLAVWIGDVRFEVKAGPPRWKSSRKEGGDGIQFVAEITNTEDRVFRKPMVLCFDKCPQPEVWFIEEKYSPVGIE